jgi:hypothetical protein
MKCLAVKDTIRGIDGIVNCYDLFLRHYLTIIHIHPCGENIEQIQNIKQRACKTNNMKNKAKNTLLEQFQKPTDLISIDLIFGV